MTSKEILNTRNEKGILFLSTDELEFTGLQKAINEDANWYAVSRDGTHMIAFCDTDENRYYKTQESFAKRVSQLIRLGR